MLAQLMPVRCGCKQHTAHEYATVSGCAARGTDERKAGIHALSGQQPRVRQREQVRDKGGVELRAAGQQRGIRSCKAVACCGYLQTQKHICLCERGATRHVQSVNASHKPAKSTPNACIRSSNPANNGETLPAARGRLP